MTHRGPFQPQTFCDSVKPTCSAHRGFGDAAILYVSVTHRQGHKKWVLFFFSFSFGAKLFLFHIVKKQCARSQLCVLLFSAPQHWGTAASRGPVPPALGLAGRQGTGTVACFSWAFFLCVKRREAGA